MFYKINNIHRVFIFCSFLLILSSCASKEDKVFKQNSNEDLVETFDLEKFKKFSEKVDTSKNDEPKKKVEKKVTKKAKKVYLKEVPPFITEKPKKKKEKPKQVEPKVSKKDTDGYPKDYPPQYKEYDKKSKAIWKKFKAPFKPGEEYVLSLSYFGITAGHIKISTLPHAEIAGKKAFHFFARLKSASFYKRIYSLDDTLESFIGMEDFLPIKYTLIQKESVQDVNDLQIFDLENYRTYHWYKRIKKGVKKNVEKNEFIPGYFQDSFSALFFVRGLPLNLGDKFEFPIVTRGKIWLLKVHVAKEDEVEFDGEDIKALKIVAETHFPGVLKKKGDITFWYSNDHLRRLLKFEAKVKIGTLTGEMIEYKEGGK